MAPNVSDYNWDQGFSELSKKNHTLAHSNNKNYFDHAITYYRFIID